MGVFEEKDFDHHEHVSFVSDEATGLRAIISIHSTVLGPAGGGIRFYPYDNSEEALRDVLRLSRAMTYKFAIAGIPLGGGKSVIIGDPKTDKTEALLEVFGRAVDRLGGRYICAEDVGMTPEDIAIIHRQTKYCAGLPGKSGDTSPLTGYGVFHALRAGVKRRLGRDNLNGLTVAVQGSGKVGRHLCTHLAKAGARIFIADVNQEAAERAVDEFGATAASTDDILFLDVEVLAPCALGGGLNDETVPKIKAKVICGGANNQLAEDRHGQALAGCNILFVPDYVANAGGAFSGSREMTGVSEAETIKKVEAIYDTCNRVFARAEQDGVPTNVAADRLAQEVIEAKLALRRSNQPDRVSKGAASDEAYRG